MERRDVPTHLRQNLPLLIIQSEPALPPHWLKAALARSANHFHTVRTVTPADSAITRTCSDDTDPAP